MQAVKDSLDSTVYPRLNPSPSDPMRSLPLRVLLALGIALGLTAGLILGLQAVSGPSGSPRGGVVTDGDLVSVAKRVELPGTSEIARPGDVLTYTLTITNNDVATLASIVVTDSPSLYVTYVPSSTLLDTGSGPAPVDDNSEPPFFPLATGYIINDLAADEAAVLSYTVQVTEPLSATVDRIENLVEVLALSDLVTAALTIPAAGHPGLALEKTTAFTLSAEAPGVLARSGDTVTWTYTVTNTGALSLTNLVLVDSDPVVTPTLSSGDLDLPLAPGATLTYTAAGIAVAGAYSNTALVSAETAGGLAVSETVTASATSFYFGIDPALELTKAASSAVVTAGDAVTYTYDLTNTGNVTLTSVTVSDDLCTPLAYPGGEEPALDGFSLAVSETVQLLCTRALTTTTTNVATAAGIDPLGAPITTTATATVTVQRAELVLTKTPSALEVNAGTPVTYSYAVSNTGDFTVTALALSDDRCGPVTALPGSEDALAVGLAPGEGADFSCTAVITEPTVNMAVVSGLDPLSNTVTATATAFVNVPVGGIELTKAASAPYIRAGSLVTYTYMATNTGTIPWVEVTVEDDRCGPVQPVDPSDDPIDPAASRTFVCTTILVADTTNIATATATLTDGATISATASAFVDVAFYWIPLLEKGELPPADCPLPAGCEVPGVDGVKALAYHTVLDRLYILSQDAMQVTMLDPVTFAVLEQVATGPQPWGMVLNETTNRLFVSNFAGSSITVYDATTLVVVDEITVDGNPSEMALLPALDTVFVLTRPDSRVVVIEGLTPVQDLNAGGSGPFGIAVDVENERIYISHRDSGSLSLLQQGDDGWEALPGPQFDDGRQYFGLAWDGAGEKLYLLAADSESQWRVEVWRPSVTPPWSLLTAPAIPSGGAVDDPNVGGAGLIINPATAQIYTANTGADSLSRLEGVNDTVVGDLPTDAEPFVLALDPATNTIFVAFRTGAQVAKFTD